MRKIPIGKILIAVSVLAVVGLVVFLALPKPVGVDIVPVVRGELLVTVDDDGKTRIKQEYRFVISAPLEGQLRKIIWQEGDRVYAGKDIAKLDPRIPNPLDERARQEADARVSVAEENKKKAEAMHADAKLTYKLAFDRFARAMQLLADESISRDEFDERQNQKQITKAKMDAAKFAQEVAKYELDLAKRGLLIHTKPGQAKLREFTIPSPGFETFVLKVLEKHKRVVTPGAQLIEVGVPNDPRKMEVVVDVLSEDAVMIKEGAKVLLERWGSEDRPTLLGKVHKVEPKAFLKISALGVEEQRVNVIVNFAEDEGELNDEPNSKRDPENYRYRLGDAYRVQARIVIWEGKKVVKVPAGALFRATKGGNGGNEKAETQQNRRNWAVFVVENNRARLRIVQVGKSNGLETQITSGLQEGETVILHPSDQIQDGVAVFAR